MHRTLALPRHAVDGRLPGRGARVLARVEQLCGHEHDPVVGEGRDEPEEEDHGGEPGAAAGDEVGDGAGLLVLAHDQVAVEGGLAVVAGDLKSV